MSFVGPLPIDMWVEIAGWAQDARTWATVRATHPLIAERLDPGEAKKCYARLIDVQMTESPFEKFYLPLALNSVCPAMWMTLTRARFYRLPNGALHGRFELIIGEGSVFAEGSFVDDFLDGPWLVREFNLWRGIPAHVKERGTFRRGVREGRWCRLDEKGSVTRMEEYRDGVRVECVHEKKRPRVEGP